MNRTVAQLRIACSHRGIIWLQTDGKKELLHALAMRSIAEREANGHHVSQGLRLRMKIESPMLCFSYAKLTPAQQTAAMHGPDWVGEEKYDGVRMLIVYHPSEGYTFFGRNTSTKDFLPIEYTDKIVMPYTDTLLCGPFILDAECMSVHDVVDTGKTITKTKLQAVTAILSTNTEDSRWIQIDNPLCFKAFDILYHDGGSVMDASYLERNQLLYNVADNLPSNIEMSDKYEDRADLYKRIIDNGGEGIVLKHKDAAYIPTTSRRRDVQVKVKRSMAVGEKLGIDAYIIGSVPPTPGKGRQNFIGGVKFGVLVGGKEHHVATVTSMPDSLREAMTSYQTDGTPMLNNDYLLNVHTINGQDVSARTHRLTHAICIDWTPRADKDADDCTMTWDTLEGNVL